MGRVTNVPGHGFATRMKFSRFLLLAVVLFHLPQVRGAGLAVEELINKLAARNSETVSIRAKLTVTDPASGVRNATQILVKQRRAGEVRTLLYQVLWPPSRKGEALCLEKSDSGVVTGFFFEPPDKVTPFAPAHSQDAYLDSNLSIEDLTEDLWQWPSQKITGEEVVNGEVCQILDSSPPAGLHSSY